MQIIVKCPECSKNMLITTGAGYMSEVILTQEKKCSGCAKQVKIQVKIIAELVKPPKEKKSSAAVQESAAE